MAAAHVVCAALGKERARKMQKIVSPPTATTRPLWLVVLSAGLIVGIAMGIRQVMGLYLSPMTQALGIGREPFSTALGIANLVWGIGAVFAGMVADRFGAFRVLVGGCVLYALGLAGMALSPNALVFTLTAGVLIGAAQAGTTYAVVYGVIGRNVPANRRSWAMGIAAAAGSFGQFLMEIGRAHV